MRRTTIDRLTLHAGPLSDSEARHLAELVAVALGEARLTSAERVSVKVPASVRSVEQLAAMVTDAIVEALTIEGAR